MELNSVKMQILEIGLLVLSAYICGIIAKKLKIGEVIGQILGGILVGPHFLEIIHRVLEHFSGLERYSFFKPIYHFYQTGFEEYAQILEGYHFFVFLFLGLIAFSLGEELHRDRIRSVGVSATLICLLQALLTWVAISMGFYFVFHFSLINSLLIGSIGIATAPALTFILMSKLNIEGKLRNILANIVVLDDIIEVIFFSIFLGIAVVLKDGEHLSFVHILKEVSLELFWASMIGVAIFFILKVTIKKNIDVNNNKYDHLKDGFLSTVLSEHPTPSVEILLIMFGVIAIGISVAIHFHLPFLITAVVAGFLISNFHSNEIFDSLKINNVMPIFNLIFFAIIGATVRIESFSTGTLFYVLGYLVLRAFGKLFGNWLGCQITNQDPKITACLPKLMLPQAGMAAVETILVATVLAGKGGEMIFNTIIPALVIFELGGAVLSEKTLLRWKNWTTGERDIIRKKESSGELYLLEDLIQHRVIELMGTTIEETIFEISQLLVKDGVINETSIVTQPVLERERLSTTAIGNGIALPHCKSGSVEDVHVICAYLHHPVNWKAPDKEKVDFLVMIVSPEKYPERHLIALSTIANAIHKHDFKNGLRAAFQERHIPDYLKNLDERMTGHLPKKIVPQES